MEVQGCECGKGQVTVAALNSECFPWVVCLLKHDGSKEGRQSKALVKLATTAVFSVSVSLFHR